MGSFLSSFIGGGDAAAATESTSAGTSGPSRVIAFHSSNSWQLHFNSSKQMNKLIVVDFSASWCGPSKFMEPVFNDMSSKYTDVDFAKIDVDELSTEMGRAIGTIQGAVLHIQRAQDVVLGDLRVVTGQVGDLQRADAMTRSNLRTFDYQYHQLHDQVSRIGSRMETIDENVARISGTFSSFSQQLASFPTSASAGPPHQPDPSASHLPPGST